MKNARFGVIFFGMGVTQSLGKNHNIDEAIMVTKDMNEYTKFAIIAMRGHYNVTGSGQVWGGSSGSRSRPTSRGASPGTTPARPRPTTCSGGDEVRRGLRDRPRTPARTSRSRRSRGSRELPSVAIDPNISPTTEISNLHVPVAIVGDRGRAAAATGWTTSRSSTRKVVEPPEGMMTDFDFLRRVRDRINELKAKAPVGSPSTAQVQGA